MIPLLGTKVATATKARELVIAPRLPPRSQLHTGDPFTSEGDVFAECQTCFANGDRRFHLMGKRKDVKAALAVHHQQHHPDQIGVVLLNTPRQ